MKTTNELEEFERRRSNYIWTYWRRKFDRYGVIAASGPEYGFHRVMEDRAFVHEYAKFTHLTIADGHLRPTIVRMLALNDYFIRLAQDDALSQYDRVFCARKQKKRMTLYYARKMINHGP